MRRGAAEHKVVSPRRRRASCRAWIRR